MERSDNSVLRGKNIRVKYDTRVILHNVAFEAHAGELVCILGPNGSGKTTLMRALAQLVPYDGQIWLDEMSLQHLSRRRRSEVLGYVPQEPLFPEGLRVNEYVALGARDPSPGTPSDALRRALDVMKLSSLANRRLSSLSGGERRRAAVAQGLAQETPVLLLDEPTASLDFGHAQQLLFHLQTVARDRNALIVLSTHDLTLAARFADRLIVLRYGHVLANGTVKDVLSSELIETLFDMPSEIVMHTSGPLIALLPTK